MNEIIKLIDVKLAINTMLAFLSFVILFHILVLFEIISSEIVWGGKLESTSQMRIFETISIVINLIIITVVGIKGKYIRAFLPENAVKVILWLLVVLFTLNTVGNMFSETTLETIMFTPLTLMSAILCYRIVIEE
ncbi:MAG: hypothetical protein GQ470_05445 [Gammaproteobacteria bacterium]|nr:hypothetical protein [Gammaproteobacteria bacterium]